MWLNYSSFMLARQEGPTRKADLVEAVPAKDDMSGCPSGVGNAPGVTVHDTAEYVHLGMSKLSIHYSMSCLVV
jgi:hypothetical protein